MKPLFILFFLLLTAGLSCAASSPANLDIPIEAQAKYEEAEALRDKDQYNLSYPIYADLLQKYPSSFSINYGYGLLLAQMKRFQDSAEALKTALNIGKSKEQMPDPSIWNSIGWVALMNGNLDQAVEYFNVPKNNPAIYSKLNDETRMKLHNNAGYALMLMDRYEQAKEDFKKAEQLGSDKAKLNIEKIDSLIETQQRQDPNIPGVFTVVVFSVKNKDWLDRAIQTISGRLVSKELAELAGIDVYLAKNGLYMLTLGGSYSYVKAQGILEKIKKSVPDAFVSSTTNWEAYRIGGKQVSPAGTEKQE